MWSKVYLRPCPECGATVVWPDNSTLLDWPNEVFSDEACWTIEKVINFPGFRNRTRYLAMKGRPPVLAVTTEHRAPIRVGHRLHEHQPPESIVRRGVLPWAVAIREDRHAR